MLTSGAYYVRVYSGNSSKTGKYTLYLSSYDTYIDGGDADLSVGQISLADQSKSAFIQAGTSIQLQSSKNNFLTDPTKISVYRNGELVEGSVIGISGNKLTLSPSLLQEGLNNLQIYAQDVTNNLIQGEISLWAGSATFTVKIVDQTGQPVNDVIVTAKLGDDQNITTQATTVNGQVVFKNLPSRTVLFEALSLDKKFAATGEGIVEQGVIELKLLPFAAPSTIENNDFRLGLEGWDLSGATSASLMPHIDTPQTAQSASTKNGSTIGTFTSATTPAKRQQVLNVTSNQPTAFPASPTAEDWDLKLNTAGEAEEQRVARTFRTEAGVTNVTVLYRFTTSEIPGGYFGSEYNDYYRLELRSQKTGRILVASNTMNGLGLTSFDSKGNTGWLELDLEVDPNGDIVQLLGAVSNVADSQLDSDLIIAECVKRKPAMRIESAYLRDMDNPGPGADSGEKLQFLSISPKNPYFGGYTLINGDIRLKGNPDILLDAVELEIASGSTKISAQLSPKAKLKILDRALGNSGISLSTSGGTIDSGPLFLLDNTQAGFLNLNESVNRNLALTIVARGRTNKGIGGLVETRYKIPGQVTMLSRLTDIKRYGQRDEKFGGDDWVVPSLIPFVKQITNLVPGLEIGDISNMNAGSFQPDHATHNLGRDIDAWFPNYNPNSAASAKKILNILNKSTYAKKIEVIFAEYSPGSAFEKAIQNVRLQDGRRATDVIRSVRPHKDHFHIRVNVN